MIAISSLFEDGPYQYDAETVKNSIKKFLGKIGSLVDKNKPPEEIPTKAAGIRG